jgi:DNA-binding NtrC family response regulator
VAANVALARIPAREGLVQPPRSARSLDAVLFCGVLWLIGASLATLRWLWPSSSAWLEPRVIDYAGNAACIASVLGLMAASDRLRRARRLELGVLERVSGALAMCGVALALALPSALLGLAAPYRALAAATLLAALACAWVAALRDPTLISRALRGGLLVLVLGAPLALAAAALAARLPERASLIALCGCALGALVGILGRSGLWLPAEVRRTRVYEAAARAVLRADPSAATLAVLEALQGAEQNLQARAELWRRDPPEMWRADVAGYLHTEVAEVPEEVYELAQAEPERLLRREVLVELEVRRPEVRGALEWLEGRGAFAVGLISDEHGALGLLTLPRGARRAPVTLAEARAARALCERLSAVLGLSSTLARARAREEQAFERAERLEQERSRLETRIVGQTRHRDSVAEVLADSVRVATYGTRARRTLRELERHAAAARDVSIDLPVGVDALAWACAFHQTGTARTGPLVVSDGTTAATHPVAYWTHETDAPTRRAEGGTLVVLHVTALPEEAQVALSNALSQRAAHGSKPCVLVATLNEPPEQALQAGRLVAQLAWYLVPFSLRVPALRERAEDLRGLILAQLLASGVRRKGQPLGVEPQALAALTAHDWPGNDAELALVVQRAARAASAERVTVADLELAGFKVPAPAAQVVPAAAAELLVPQPSARAAGARATRGAAARPGGSRTRRQAVSSEPPVRESLGSDAPPSKVSEMVPSGVEQVAPSSEAAPNGAAAAAANAEPAAEALPSERPVPKRSERVRKPRSRRGAASAAADELHEGHGPASGVPSESSEPQHSEHTDAAVNAAVADAAADGGGRSSARRRRRR